MSMRMNDPFASSRVMFAYASSSSISSPRCVSFSATFARSSSAAIRSSTSSYADTTRSVCARLEDAFAEQRRVRVQPLVVQAAEHGDALVERLAGDEPGRAEPHAVAPDERLHAPAVGGREDRLPQPSR